MEKTINCYCSLCKQKTHHYVLAEYSRGSDADADFWWHEDLRLVKCCGCEHVSFDLESVDESDVEYLEDGSETLVSQHRSYPEKEGFISCVEYTWGFPSNVYSIYKETITAINENCNRLAVAGLRATIEAICIDKKIGYKNLEAKINGLKKAGIITEADRNRLHTVRFMGNDAIHHMIEPSRDSLLLVNQIINGILTNLYVIDNKISGKLECPIRTVDEFIILLDEGLKSRRVGEVNILNKLLPENRRLIKEDLSRFEAELQDMINAGHYKKLSLCPPPKQGHNQKYRINTI